MQKPEWKDIAPSAKSLGEKYTDITFKKSGAVARIAFNRPAVRNAFRPRTTAELYDAFYNVQEDASIGVVLLSGEGPSPKDGVYAFCSGGDQKARGKKVMLVKMAVIDSIS